MVTTVHRLLEDAALTSSSAVFVYDTTPTDGFGSRLSKKYGDQHQAQVYPMQTRIGAGTSLVGFVEKISFTSQGASSNNETEQEAEDNSASAAASTPAKRPSATRSISQKKVKTGITQADKSITIIANSNSFLSLVPSLLALPASNLRPNLAVQISAQTSSTENNESAETPALTQVPDLSSLFEGVTSLCDGGWNGAVVLSETAEQAAFVGTAITQQANQQGHDVINVFDGVTAGREVSNLQATAVPSSGEQTLEAILQAVPPFSYYGSNSAKDVLVLPGSVYSVTAKVALAALDSASVGIIVVRVVKPWNAQAFQALIPQSARALHVFAEAKQDESIGWCYDDVLSTLLASGRKLKVRGFPLAANFVPSVQEFATRIENLSNTENETTAANLKSLLPASSKLVTFWDVDASTGKSETVPAGLAHAFSGTSTGVEPKLLVTYDNFQQGGLQQANLLLQPAGQAQQDFNVPELAAVSPASLLFISSPAAVFKAYEPINEKSVGPETRIVIAANWTADEFATKLPFTARETLVKAAAGKNNLFVIDADKIAKEKQISSAVITEIVFWSMYLPANISPKEILNILQPLQSFAAYDEIQLSEILGTVRNSITAVEIQQNWGDEPMDTDEKQVKRTLPRVLIPTAAGPNPDRTFAEPTANILGNAKKSWHQPAQRLLFPEAYAREQEFTQQLRPDLPEKNYLITVTENRRLTPNTYDRNVFHLEFSTAGTGLKYAVGEALGIHGWNDEKEVLEFLEWYGLDPEAIISVPSKLDPQQIEQRTLFQLFQQNLDIFGKPGKTFYETLSKFATNKNEERALRFIACPDGHATFKKMSETETVTYVDLLKQFPSARPSVQDLVREVEEIHPRHYSIASSQNFVGDAVHLLIVTVEWDTPKGTARYGQCTRYLNNLRAGDKVMVSVKPSVMKLPPLDTQPIIMAGLGTGAAPFRAFIQERAWQKAQGIEIGPSLYYFGSRHRSKEYLYGEEIEAYVQEGIVTHAGLAFSRDTDKKVYIQHKMNEDAELLARMMRDGAFYLCGPTWPVPDVYEALVKAFVSEGKSIEDAQKHIEQLKEEERYVLEVY